MKIAVTSPEFPHDHRACGQDPAFPRVRGDGAEVREWCDWICRRSLRSTSSTATRPTPSDGVDVLLTARCGDNFVVRMARRASGRRHRLRATR